MEVAEQQETSSDSEEDDMFEKDLSLMSKKAYTKNFSPQETEKLRTLFLVNGKASITNKKMLS